MSIKAVAFDIDGTLYPNRQMYLLSLSSFLASPRLAWHFSQNRKAIRRVEEISNFRKVQAEMIAERMQADPAETFAEVEVRLYKNWERAFRFLRPYRGAAEVLRQLKDRGLKLGVLSDFPPQKKLKYMKLDGFWDACFSSEEVNYLKPRPEPFLELAHRLGCEPGEILYVGNSYKYDILGASAAGMKTAFLTGEKQVPPADIVFRSYPELGRKILTLLDGE